MEIRAAPVGVVAHADEVVAGLLEGVGQARVGLQAGGITAVPAGQFVALGIVQLQLRVESAAQAAAEYLKAQTLPGLD